MSLRLLAIPIALITVLIGGPASQASVVADDRLPDPPAATLLGDDGRTQRGNLQNHCWSRLDPPFIAELCWHQDFFSFPKRPLRSAGTAAVVFDTPERPDRVLIRYWTEIDRADFGRMWFDTPRGKRRSTVSTLEPLVDGGGVRWKASFTLDPAKVAYVAVRGEWTDLTCLGCRQWGVWAFTLR